jgi:PST family polysaccharide transporter
MSSMKKVFIDGVFYTAAAKYSGLIVSLVVAAILSRQLLPAEFGTVAVAMVFIAFFSIVSDMGIGPAIIQKKELTAKDLSHIFSLTLYLAVISAVVFFLSSGLAANYYGEPALAHVGKVLSVHLFFSVANVVPNGLLLKEKEFRFIAIRTLAVQAAGGALSIGAAMSGWGIDALLIAPVFSSIAIFVVSYWRYRLPFSWAIGRSSVRKIFSYSVFQFLFNVINFFSRNLDNLLIGKYLGLSPLGYYEKSYRLMLWPMSNFSYVLISVIHPVFSDYRHDLRYVTERYLKVVKLLATVGFPLSVVLFFSAEELILLLFGDQWAASVPVFQCLCLSMGFQMVLSSSGALFRTADATRWLFIDGLLSTVVTVICLLVGLFYFQELNWVALLISASFIVNFFKSFYILFRWALRQPLILFFRQLIRPLLVGGAMAGLTFALLPFVPENLLLALALKAIVLSAAALALIHLFKIYDVSKIGIEWIRKWLKYR